MLNPSSMEKALINNDPNQTFRSQHSNKNMTGWPVNKSELGEF